MNLPQGISGYSRSTRDNPRLRLQIMNQPS
jgi:hypothetical protein